MKVTGLDILRCDAGWRNYHFLKLTTDDGIVGWSEFDEGFGSPGVGAVIERLRRRVVGQDALRPRADLYRALLLHPAGRRRRGRRGARCDRERACSTPRPRRSGVPCYVLLGGKVRDRVRVYWSHCATWRINHPHSLSSRRSPASTASRRSAPKCARRASPRSRPTSSSTRAATPRGWRPGFGVPFLPELNVDKHVLRNLRDPSRRDARGCRTRCRPAARPQLQRQDRGVPEDPEGDRRFRHVLGRDRQLQPGRRSAISGGRARTRSARARPCSDCASSCPISASRRWMSRSSTRCGTGCGRR